MYHLHKSLEKSKADQGVNIPLVLSSYQVIFVCSMSSNVETYSVVFFSIPKSYAGQIEILIMFSPYKVSAF